MKTWQRRRRGFTLLEVTIALLVIVIGMYAVTVCIMNTASLTTTTQQVGLALNGAREKLEEIRASEFIYIQSTYDDQYFAIPGLLPLDANQPTHIGRVDVATGDPNEVSDPNQLLIVTIYVTWSDRGNRRLQKLDTVIVNRYPAPYSE